MNIEGNKTHNVLMLAGMGDQASVDKMKFITEKWKQRGLHVTLYNVGWRDGSDFEPKLEEITKLVDELAKKGPVSVVGCSAGASAAFNVFLRRHDVIQKVISVCGRLRNGQHKWRSLKRVSANNKPLEQSILLFNGQEAQIPEELKKRMMTVSARLGDPIVPSDTSDLEGAYNIKILSGGHSISIAAALTIFSKPVIDFIKLTPEGLGNKEV